MNVLFVAGFGPISSDEPAARHFYGEVLRLPLQDDEGYLHTEALEGVKGFGVWPLRQAAESCFGRSEWPADEPVPQAWIEFDVDDIEAASQELEERGYKLLVSRRKEPWGQVVSRLVSPEGLLVGVTITPSMRPEPGS
jgi:predicted enzyme related to lactoylglutathione lyase